MLTPCGFVFEKLFEVGEVRVLPVPIAKLDLQLNLGKTLL